MTRLPPPPPKRHHSQHSPRARKSALERARELERGQGPSFDPAHRGTWRGSSRDLVVNGARRTNKRGHQLPDGTWVRLYYAQAERGEPWTAVLDSKAWNATARDRNRIMIGMTESGLGSQFTEGQEGRHLGREVPWEEAPEGVRRTVTNRGQAELKRNGDDEEWSKTDFVVHLDNLDDRDGVVMAEVHGEGALAWAEYDQSIAGSNWEGSDGDDFAYALPVDYPGLVAELEAEGYELNLDNYSEPDVSDNFEDYSRQGIGNILLQWHAGQGDPIYAVGSFFVSGKAHPQRDVVEAALGEVERLERKANGNEQRELHAAAEFLREDLRLHRNGGRGLKPNAGAGDYLPEHLRHVEFRYNDPPEENGDSVRYGSFESTRHAGGGKPEPGEWYLVNYAGGSDYNGGSVMQSNYRVLKEELEREHPEGETPAVWATTYGGHGTYGILVVWDRLSESIQEMLNGLDDYPLISEDDHSALEIDEQNASWENWGRRDFLKELVDYLNGHLATFSDREIDELELSDDEAFGLFRLAAEVGNIYWEDQQGSGQYIDMDRVAGVASDLITGKKAIPGWAANSYGEAWDSIEKIRRELGIRA